MKPTGPAATVQNVVPIYAKQCGWLWQFASHRQTNDMRQTAKYDKERFVFRLLSPVPLPLWRALSRVSLILPYYHIVTDEDVPHVKHLYVFRNVKRFREDLDFFRANYSPVGLADVIDHLNKGTVLPKRPLLLSFDDGFREMHDVVAPILKEKGVPATFFLATGFLDNRHMAHHNQASVLVEHLIRDPDKTLLKKVEQLLDQRAISGNDVFSRLLGIRYLDRDLVTDAAALCECDLEEYLSSARPYLTSHQVRHLLAQGFTIGGHSVDHPLYSELSLADQLFQTEESLRFLVERFQITHRAFAFPHSDSGVSRQFFQRLQTEGKLDVSFGTAGMVKHSCARNLERFAMERSLLPADRVVAINHLRGLRRRMFA
jgi:peptidoglycan/xylan/chitin deacetylase (PgdA/CDA1 family)